MHIHIWSDFILYVQYVHTFYHMFWHGVCVCCAHFRGCRRTDIKFIMAHNISRIFLFCLISVPCRWWMNFGSYSFVSPVTESSSSLSFTPFISHSVPDIYSLCYSFSSNTPYHFRRHPLIYLFPSAFRFCIILITHVCMCERRLRV